MFYGKSQVHYQRELKGGNAQFLCCSSSEWLVGLHGGLRGGLREHQHRAVADACCGDGVHEGGEA